MWITEFIIHLGNDTSHLSFICFPLLLMYLLLCILSHIVTPMTCVGSYKHFSFEYKQLSHAMTCVKYLFLVCQLHNMNWSLLHAVGVYNHEKLTSWKYLFGTISNCNEWTTMNTSETWSIMTRLALTSPIRPRILPTLLEYHVTLFGSSSNSNWANTWSWYYDLCKGPLWGQ